MSKILSNKARCKLCNTVIESAYRHDFQSCLCGAISVDGGHEYLRRSGDLSQLEDLSEICTPVVPVVSVTPLDAGAALHVVQNNTVVTTTLSKKEIEKLLFDLDCAYAEILYKENL